MRHAAWITALPLLLAGPALAQDAKPVVVAKLDGHRGGVSALAFNPKVPVIATGSGNGVVRLWEAKTGDPITRMEAAKPTGARVNHLGFSADGTLLSASSRNALVVWDIVPPKREVFEPKGADPKEPPKDTKDPFGGRPVPIVFEDSLGTDAAKVGTVTGDGKRAYLSSGEGVRVTVGSRVFAPRLGLDTNDDLKGAFAPWAVAAISDSESALVAMYGTVRAADKSEQPALALVGLGDARVIGRGAVRPATAGRAASLSFAPDGKWLVACNGADVMYWRVPGSQLVEGDPKLLPNAAAYTAAAGPNGRVAFASVPEDGKKVKVTIADLTGSQPKVVATYATTSDRVSALAFSHDGGLLAVGNDTDGVVELWDATRK
jgi:hypothetical protein